MKIYRRYYFNKPYKTIEVDNDYTYYKYLCDYFTQYTSKLQIQRYIREEKWVDITVIDNQLNRLLFPDRVHYEGYLI